MFQIDNSHWQTLHGTHTRAPKYIDAVVLPHTWQQVAAELSSDIADDK